MRPWFLSAALAAVIVAPLATARADIISVTYGAAGMQSASAIVVKNATTIGTETFDSVSGSNFITTYGTGGVISGAYSGAVIANADLYGGAGGAGRYVEALGNGAGYTITLSTNGVPGVNYFGYWLSALDAGNQISFLRNNAVVGTYSPSDLVSALGTCSGNNAYCGNPTTPFKGQDAGEPFAFVNFVDLNGFFDKIIVSESPAVGNYESDNHTVGYCAVASACVSGTSVPEPLSLTLLGAGLAGLAFIRWRKQGSL